MFQTDCITNIYNREKYFKLVTHMFVYFCLAICICNAFDFLSVNTTVWFMFLFLMQHKI